MMAWGDGGNSGDWLVSCMALNNGIKSASQILSGRSIPLTSICCVRTTLCYPANTSQLFNETAPSEYSFAYYISEVSWEKERHRNYDNHNELVRTSLF